MEMSIVNLPNEIFENISYHIGEDLLKIPYVSKNWNILSNTDLDMFAYYALIGLGFDVKNKQDAFKKLAMLEKYDYFKNSMDLIEYFSISVYDYQDIELIKLLLTNKWLDVSCGEFDNIINGVCCGFWLDLIKLFWNHSRINNNHLGEYILHYYTSSRGYSEMVKLVLEDPRVTIENYNPELIILASEKGNAKLVQLLLADQRFDPTIEQNIAIRYAAQNGQAEVVKLLLADQRVDPTSESNDAIVSAAKNNHPEVVELLLTDGRIDANGKYTAVMIAAEKGHADVVLLLMDDKDVNDILSENRDYILVKGIHY